MAKTYYATIYTSELIGGLYPSREDADTASLNEALRVVKEFFQYRSEPGYKITAAVADEPIDGKLWSAISWLHENRHEITRQSRVTSVVHEPIEKPKGRMSLTAADEINAISEVQF